MNKKSFEKKQLYISPQINVEEVLLEEGFLGGSHENYTPPTGSHETMEETNDSFNNGDFTFT